MEKNNLKITYGDINDYYIRNRLQIGCKIRQRLQEIDMTETELNNRLGKHVWISDIISGGEPLTIDTITEIEYILDIKLIVNDYIF